MKPCEQRQRADLKEKGVRQRLKEKLEKGMESGFIYSTLPSLWFPVYPVALQQIPLFGPSYLKSELHSLQPNIERTPLFLIIEYSGKINWIDSGGAIQMLIYMYIDI